MNKNFEDNVVNIIKKYFFILIIFMIIGAFTMAKVEGSKANESYSAKATIAVTSAEGYGNSTLDDIKKNQSLVAFYAKLATSSLTFDKVVKAADLDNDTANMLSKIVTTTFDKDAQYIDITITTEDKNKTLKIAKAEVNALIEIGRTVRGEDMLKTVSYPQDIEKNVSASKKGFYLTGAVGGLIIGLVVVAVLHKQKNVRSWRIK